MGKDSHFAAGSLGGGLGWKSRLESPPLTQLRPRHILSPPVPDPLSSSASWPSSTRTKCRENQLKKERFILAHDFPWDQSMIIWPHRWARVEAEQSTVVGTCEQSCLLYGGQEAERQTDRQRELLQNYPRTYPSDPLFPIRPHHSQ